MAKYGDVLLSRYHFDLITVWTNLKLMNNKPKVGFSSHFHTPLVECDDYEFEGGNASRNLRELIWLRGLISAFAIYPLREATEGRIFSGSPLPYAHVPIDNSVPSDRVFTLDNILGMVVMGKTGSLPPEMQKLINDKNVHF